MRPALRELAALDLLALGTGPERAGELPAVVSLVEELGARCLATAFSAWAHRMVIDYLAHAPHPDRAADLVALTRAERLGSTGLAPALRELAGFGAVPLVARRDGDGLRVDGPVSWASNLFPGTLLVVPVRVGDGRAVVAIDVDAPGSPCTRREAAFLPVQAPTEALLEVLRHEDHVSELRGHGPEVRSHGVSGAPGPRRRGGSGP